VDQKKCTSSRLHGICRRGRCRRFHLHRRWRRRHLLLTPRRHCRFEDGNTILADQLCKVTNRHNTTQGIGTCKARHESDTNSQSRRPRATGGTAEQLSTRKTGTSRTKLTQPAESTYLDGKLGLANDHPRLHLGDTLLEHDERLVDGHTRLEHGHRTSRKQENRAC